MLRACNEPVGIATPNRPDVSTFTPTSSRPMSSFELNCPGRIHVLAANGNLCRAKLVMPTEFVAQSGATLNQETHIEVEGCSNTLSLVSKSIHKKTLTLKVYVPAGGKVTASGKGLSKGSKSSSGRETVTFTLHASKKGKFDTKVKLSFKPAKGKGQSKTVKLKA